MPRYTRPDVSFTKVINTDVTHKLLVQKDVFAQALVINNVADAEANASALGRNTLAETHTLATATDGSSTAQSESIAASDNYNYDLIL